MMVGPVLRAELRTTSRRGRYYALRTLFGLTVLLAVYQGYSENQLEVARAADFYTALANASRHTFFLFGVAQVLFLVLVTPAMVAGVVAEESQRRTFHDLLTSELSSAAIVLGKLTSRLLHLGVLMAIGLPIFIILNLYGGLDPALIARNAATTGAATFCIAGLSILMSSVCARPRTAIALSYGGLLTWFALPWALSGTVEYGSWPGPFKS